MATPTQAEIAVTRDVIYKREPGHDLPLDVYEPSSYLATIVDVHGGGWFHGDKAKDEDLATRLAKRGFRVVVPNYRLTPEFRFPAGVDDVLDAGVWARSTAATGLKKVGFIWQLGLRQPGRRGGASHRAPAGQLVRFLSTWPARSGNSSRPTARWRCSEPS